MQKGAIGANEIGWNRESVGIRERERERMAKWDRQTAEQFWDFAKGRRLYVAIKFEREREDDDDEKDFLTFAKNRLATNESLMQYLVSFLSISFFSSAIWFLKRSNLIDGRVFKCLQFICVNTLTAEWTLALIRRYGTG